MNHVLLAPDKFISNCAAVALFFAAHQEGPDRNWCCAKKTIAKKARCQKILKKSKEIVKQ
jgi:hypothetical protein